MICPIESVVEGYENEERLFRRPGQNERAPRRAESQRDDDGKTQRDAHDDGELHIDGADHAAVIAHSIFGQADFPGDRGVDNGPNVVGSCGKQMSQRRPVIRIPCAAALRQVLS